MKNWKNIFFKKRNDQIDKFQETKSTRSQNQKILKKKFNKLKHKALYLDAEYEEVSDIFAHAKSEFISSIFNYCSNRKIRPPLSDGKKSDDTTNNKLETSQEMKDLYREIVKVTHPDKTKSLEEDEIEERTELYQEAVLGKQKGDYWGIFKAALELGVPIKNLSFEYLEELEQTILKIEEKSNIMKNDLMYKWFHCDKEARENIFEQLTKNQEKYE
jgi:hypothetical protein